MFAALPTGFPKLDAAIDELGKFTLAAPPALEELGVRMRKLYAQARATGYAQLSRGALRRLPYALWIDGQPDLSTTDPDLVSAYWARELPAMVATPRTAKRWLTPLFYVYCHRFKRKDAAFDALAQQIRAVLPTAQGPVAQWLTDLHSQYHWFSPDEVGLYLGKTLALSSMPPREQLQALKLWPGFAEEPICRDAFAGALRAPNDVLAQERVVERMKLWGRADGGGPKARLRYPEHRVALADGLVRPWLSKAPPELLRNSLLSYLTKHYGDPRPLSSTHAGHHWQGVSQGTVQTVKRWMVGDTLRGFVRLLQLTADEIWRYRERFWMAYYDRGYIEEAWLALGSQAAWLAKREFGKADWAQYGTLGAGASSDQSVLLLRIGHLIFMEWSHNGSLRAAVQGDPAVPALYLPEYRADELRSIVSMDFHGGLNQNPQLAHMNSDRGTWQRKARDFIADHTGVKLNDHAIIG